PCEGQRFIVTDGVFSMDADICPLPSLLSLKKKYEACLIVDDAHSVGVIGDTGRGTAEYYHESGIDIQVGTLSKSLGAEGGYAAASKEITDYLRNVSRPFIFSTSISAVTGASALAALRLLEDNPSLYMGRLRFNTAYMKAKLSEAGIPVLPGDTSILPIIIGDEKQTLAYAKACREDGILLSAIRPPTVPAGTSRIRLTVTAAHTKDELDRAAEVMKRHWK
uniref:aminotransferase class I/II-fold pyridoxal phosphate-dependent enzyme n=1 Tax=Dialister sp. TaxID=1955814 RepID=UPI004026D709